MRSLALLLALAGCAGGLDDPRAAEIASVLARADASLIEARPALVAGKYQRLAADSYAFYRGTLPVYRHDWERGALGLSATAFPGPSVLSLGDAHPENFGVLRARDGTFAIEPNDFDGADRAPYLWDLRRLCAGVAVAARLSNPDDPAAASAAALASRAIARAAAEAYAATVQSIAAGAPRTRLDDAVGQPVLADLFERSAADTAARTELGNTVLSGGARRLRRGVLDPAVPYQTYADLPPAVYASLPAAIEAYRQTLVDPPPPAYFTLLDAAREFGAGVASWPKVRIILLVRGSSDDPGDDVLLELKELTDANLVAGYPPSVFYDDDRDRVLLTSRAAWAIPDADPLWGATTLVGFDAQIKTESGGQKTVRVKRLTGKRGTPEALAGLARALGGLLARVHAAPRADDATPAATISAAIGADAAAFADEQADVGDAYAAAVLADFPRFQTALDALGPALGLPYDPAYAPPPDLAALYGTPPDASP